MAVNNSARFSLQYLHQGVNTTFPATLESVSGSEIGSPIQLVLTSPNDLLFYFYCTVTDTMLKTMCDNLLIDTQMVGTFDRYLFPLLNNMTDKRTVCLEDDDRRTGFVFTVHDKLDFQRIYRLRLPFERATDRNLAEYLAGLLASSQKLVAAQAADIEMLKSQGDKDSKSLLERITITQNDLQRKIEELNSLTREHSNKVTELESVSLTLANLKVTSAQEIASLKATVDSLQVKEKDLTQRVLDLERNLTSTTNTLTLAQADLERTQASLTTRDNEYKRLQAELMDLTKIRDTLEREKYKLSLEVTALTADSENAAKSHATNLGLLTSQNKELLKNIEELKEAAATLNAEYGQVTMQYNTVLDERTQLEVELGKVVETLSIKTNQIFALRKNVEELTKAKEALETKVSGDAQTLAKLSAALQTAHHQKTQAETKAEKLTATVATQKNLIDKLTSLKGDELLAEMQDGHAPAARKEVLAKPPMVSHQQQFEVLDLGPMLQKNYSRSNTKTSQGSDLALSPTRPEHPGYDAASFSGSDAYSQDTNNILGILGNIRPRAENRRPTVAAETPRLPAASVKLQDSSAISAVGFASKKNSPPSAKPLPTQPDTSTSTSGDQYAMAYMNLMKNIN